MFKNIQHKQIFKEKSKYVHFKTIDIEINFTI